MFHLTKILNIRLVNALDVDLKITLSQNVPSHQKITRNGESKYVLMKKGNCACKNGKNNDYHKIYAYMAHMSSNDERSSEKYGDSSQLTNWILYSGATCHMTPEF